VLDCFGGSGTTAFVAKKLNRNFITGDISQQAVDIITKRLKGE
jgi:DNA modification methylase